MKAIRLHQVDGPESLRYEDDAETDSEGQSGARSGLCHSDHANGVRTGIPHSILLKVEQDRFRLFWVTNSRVLSKRSGRIAWVCR